MPKPIGPRARILECRTQNECRVNAPIFCRVNQADRAQTYWPACQNFGVPYPKRMSCKCALNLHGIDNGPFFAPFLSCPSLSLSFRLTANFFPCFFLFTYRHLDHLLAKLSSVQPLCSLPWCVSMQSIMIIHYHKSTVQGRKKLIPVTAALTRVFRLQETPQILFGVANLKKNSNQG